MMKKTLLCLAIGISSFYVGNFAHSLFYWESGKVQPVEESEICVLYLSDKTDEQKTESGISSETTYIHFQGGDWGYYYNLPSSKGKHTSDFYIDGGILYARMQPSPTHMERFDYDSILLDEDTFTFTTKEVMGIKYSMSGKMPNESNNFTIKGVLKKYWNDKLIFNRKIAFRESDPPDC